jgi:hypothetical protein
MAKPPLPDRIIESTNFNSSDGMLNKLVYDFPGVREDVPDTVALAAFVIIARHVVRMPAPALAFGAGILE